MPLERLSREDAAILDLEEGPIAGHTLKVLELAAPIDLADLRARVAARVDRVERLRQRLHPTPLGLSPPVWVDDEDFALERHVRGAGDRPVEAILAERLDRSRPLWAIDLLAGGRTVVAKLHHAWADGSTFLRVLGDVLWDEDGDPDPGAPAVWNPRPAPSREGLVAGGLATRARSPRGVAAGVARTLGDPRRLRVGIESLAGVPGMVVRELLPRGGPSPFAGPVGRARRVAFAAVDLSALRAAGRALPGHVTVNDVLLAGVAAGIRTWLESERRPVPGLRAKVPVSLHRPAGGAQDAGNRDSAMFVGLDCAEADPLRRLEVIHAETSTAKRHHDAQAFAALLADVGAVWRPAERLLERAASSSRAFSVNVSNVPGPRTAPSLLGARVTALRPVVEIGEGHALRVAAVSLGPTMHLGLTADPDVVAGLDVLAEGTARGIDELRAAAGA